MSLQEWHRNGWLRAHTTTPRQISDLFEIVDRDLHDARSERLSADWQFGIAYNAALKLCTIILYASGFRPEKSLAHYRTIQALAAILGPGRQSDVDYLDTCRAKRNKAEYDIAGQIGVEEARELVTFTEELRADVVSWLDGNHPELLP